MIRDWQTDIATLWSNRPSGPIRWKVFKVDVKQIRIIYHIALAYPDSMPKKKIRFKINIFVVAGLYMGEIHYFDWCLMRFCLSWYQPSNKYIIAASLFFGYLLVGPYKLINFSWKLWIALCPFSVLFPVASPLHLLFSFCFYTSPHYIST